MNASLPLTAAAERPHASAASEGVVIPQYSRRAILAVWAAATVPMGVLAWLVAPGIEGYFSGPETLPFGKALLLCMTIGLAWQFVLVVALVWREQRSLRWSTVREALWLRAPVSPTSGRSRGRLWLLVIPLAVAFGLYSSFAPELPHPAERNFGEFLASDIGQDFLHGAWGWGAVIWASLIFNTVLGEELLFRGFLLPRMQRAFGRWDWVVNGLLFTGYHVHVIWGVLGILPDMFTLAYPTKRYRSAWLGIIVHSSQSVVFGILLFFLVM